VTEYKDRQNFIFKRSATATNHRPAYKITKGSVEPNKYPATPAARPCLLDVLRQGLADLCWQRQLGWGAGLTADCQHA
jgi:hypothetical protein